MQFKNTKGWPMFYISNESQTADKSTVRNFKSSLLGKNEPIIYNNASTSEKKNGAWSVHISLLIQIRCLFHWKKQYYTQSTRI